MHTRLCFATLGLVAVVTSASCGGRMHARSSYCEASLPFQPKVAVLSTVIPRLRFEAAKMSEPEVGLLTCGALQNVILPDREMLGMKDARALGMIGAYLLVELEENCGVRCQTAIDCSSSHVTHLRPLDGTDEYPLHMAVVMAALSERQKQIVREHASELALPQRTGWDAFDETAPCFDGSAGKLTVTLRTAVGHQNNPCGGCSNARSQHCGDCALGGVTESKVLRVDYDLGRDGSILAERVSAPVWITTH